MNARRRFLRGLVSAVASVAIDLRVANALTVVEPFDPFGDAWGKMSGRPSFLLAGRDFYEMFHTALGEVKRGR
jgi:hypothetical protein